MTTNGVIAPGLQGADANGWHKEDTWAQDAASTGTVGDDAVGTYFEARYWKAHGDQFLVISERYFVVPVTQGEDAGWFDTCGQYEFMVCRDKDDPGGTEVYCDYEYDQEVTAFAYDTLEKAESICRDAALEDQRFTLHWNGELIAH